MRLSPILAAIKIFLGRLHIILACSLLLILDCQWPGNNATASPVDPHSKHEENKAESELQHGSWQVQVEDPDHHVKAEAIIQFTNQADHESCMSGNWKRLIVVSKNAKQPEFFPFSERLAYQLDGTTIVMGRTYVCDGYYFLIGKLTYPVTRGTYDAPGPGSNTELGFFSMERTK